MPNASELQRFDEHGPVVAGVSFENSNTVRPVERYARERDYATDAFALDRLQRDRDAAVAQAEELFRQNESQRELLSQLMEARADLQGQIARLETFGNEMCDKYARQSSALSKAAERNQVKRCEELTARCQQLEANVAALRLENAKLRGETTERVRG